MGQVAFKDTGLAKASDSVGTYTAVYDGWLLLSGFTCRGEFTVNTTDYASYREESNGSVLSFKPNELTAILPPRFTIQGLLLATDSTRIEALIRMGRSKGIKQMAGGLGVISAIKEANEADVPNFTSHDYIYVLIKNITFSEVLAEDKAYVNFTIQVEQVI